MSKPLIIGIDVRDLRIAQTGTKTYLNELCKQFRKSEGPCLQFHFFDTAFPVYSGKNKFIKLTEHIRFVVWKQLLLPIKAWSKNCSVLFCTDNIVPWIHLGYKTIPVLHDAFFFETPEHYNRIWLYFFKKALLAGAKRSAFIICPTEYAKDQIHKKTGINKDKLVVVYEGPQTFTVNHNIELSEKAVFPLFHLNKNEYILHVGVMDKRKNIPAIINAFKKLKEEGFHYLKLVLVGKSVSKENSDDTENILTAIKDNHLENDVILTGYLSDIELAQVYTNAAMYVFPSLNEGFGIPVLEAFGFNLPVLVANNTSLPEVGGDAVLTFDPFSADDIFLKMKCVLEDEVLKAEMIQKGSVRLKNFSWEKTANELVNIFRNTL